MKNSWQDWKRTIISTATIVATLMFYYYNDKATVQTNVARLETTFNAHCQNAKVYQIEELESRFVLRREWEASRREFNHLREDIKELSRKIDAIYDKLTDAKISQKNNS